MTTGTHDAIARQGTMDAGMTHAGMTHAGTLDIGAARGDAMRAAPSRGAAPAITAREAGHAMARVARDGGARAAVGLSRSAGRGGRAAFGLARTVALEIAAFGRIVLGRMLGALAGAVRRDPGAALRRAVPLALALAIVGVATGQGERHAAPWFEDGFAGGRADADGGADGDGVAGAGRQAPAASVAASDARGDDEVADAAAERADPVVFGLQAELADRGFYAGAIDGIAGSRTRAAIRAWQAAEGLPETGLADETVLARIRAGASDLPRPASTVRSAMPRPVPAVRPPSDGTDPVATGSLTPSDAGASGAGADRSDGEAELPLAIQRGLVAWGADIAVDGLIGPRTREAKAQYRGANGLPPDGTDADLVAHMRGAGLLP